MDYTAPIVLANDVHIIPADSLPLNVRQRFEYEDGDFAITRPRSRSNSKVISSELAAFLERFRTPKTIVEAVLEQSADSPLQAERILEDVFPAVEALIRAAMLTHTDSPRAEAIESSIREGELIAGYKVTRRVQLLEDTEVYQVSKSGEQMALKIARRGCEARCRRLFAHEAEVLQLLEGDGAPRLVELDEGAELPYLVTTWCPGVSADHAAHETRVFSGSTVASETVDLCREIVEAYGRIHDRGVLHGDVHPRNLLVDADGRVHLVDFGVARVPDASSTVASAHRAGIGYYLEPEYAGAALLGTSLPQVTPASEQYSVAAMLYFLLTGHHYLQFSAERETMLDQIAIQSARPFSAVGLSSWPEVERVVGRALSKEPGDRYASMRHMTTDLIAAMNKNTRRSAPDSSIGDETASSGISETLVPQVLKELQDHRKVLDKIGSEGPICSLNYGAAGVAYTLYRLSCIRDEPELLAAADVWCNSALSSMDESDAFYHEGLGITPKITGPGSLFHGAGGVHLAAANIAHAMGDVTSLQRSSRMFIAAMSQPEQESDLTLGASGSLLGSSLILPLLLTSDLVDESEILSFGRHRFSDILSRISGWGPIASDRDHRNLGIAHGWAGVLYALTAWCRSSGEPLPGVVTERLLELAELAEPLGRGLRWPWNTHSVPSGENPGYMAGWCNGSAGHVMLWASAYRQTGRPQFLEVAKSAAWNCWEGGDSLPQMCCGVVGRAYALLSVFRISGDEAWLRRARALAEQPAAYWLAASQVPLRYSLFKGALGVCILLADLADPARSFMPTVEEEGWANYGTLQQSQQ